MVEDFEVFSFQGTLQTCKLQVSHVYETVWTQAREGSHKIGTFWRMSASKSVGRLERTTSADLRFELCFAVAKLDMRNIGALDAGITELSICSGQQFE